MFKKPRFYAHRQDCQSKILSLFDEMTLMEWKHLT